MGSILRVIGKRLNVESFTIGKIKPTSVFRKGEAVFKNSSLGKNVENSQMTFSISDEDNLNEQIDNTIKFLKKNSKHLELASIDKTIDTIAIDFSFDSRIDRINVEVQNDYLPKELIKLAGKFNMSIWLTQWPCETSTHKK